LEFTNTGTLADMTIDYDSPQFLRNFLELQGFSMKKRFGQNFMINPQAREKIVSLACIGEKRSDKQPTHCWEIGPGLGALTTLLLDQPYQLRVFEIDHGFIRILNQLFGKRENFSLVSGDALKTWKQEFEIQGVPQVLVGNLPYSSGSVLIGTFLEEQFLPSTMVFTLQKEVGQRLAAHPGTKLYSGFSILAQMYYKIELAGDLGPGTFYPQPEVDSVIIRMIKRTDLPQKLPSGNLIARLIRVAFSSRRKTLLNNFKTLGSGDPSFLEVKTAADSLSLDLSLRGEALTSDHFLHLAQAIHRIEG